MSDLKLTATVDELAQHCLELNRLASLGRLSSAIMHDLRNALTVLSGNIQILAMKGDRASADEIADRLNRMTAQLERMQGQIERADSFSRRAAGTKYPVPPERVIGNALFALNYYIKGTSRPLEPIINTTSRMVECDASQLELAISELVQDLLGRQDEGVILLISEDVDSKWRCRIEQVISTDTKPSSRGLAIQLAALSITRMGGTLEAFKEDDREGWLVSLPWGTALSVIDDRV